MAHCERTDEHPAHAEHCRGRDYVCGGLPGVRQFDVDIIPLCTEHEQKSVAALVAEVWQLVNETFPLPLKPVDLDGAFQDVYDGLVKGEQ